MIDAIDALPVYQQVVYELPAATARVAQGRAALHAVARTESPRITDARTHADDRVHCVVSSASHGDVAVCDNATLISLPSAKSARATPAVMTQPLAVAAEASLPRVTGPAEIDMQTGFSSGESPTRRWLADLLMTAGIGLLLVSCFLFITSRIPTPTRPQ